MSRMECCSHRMSVNATRHPSIMLVRTLCECIPKDSCQSLSKRMCKEILRRQRLISIWYHSGSKRTRTIYVCNKVTLPFFVCQGLSTRHTAGSGNDRDSCQYCFNRRHPEIITDGPGDRTANADSLELILQNTKFSQVLVVVEFAG